MRTGSVTVKLCAGVAGMWMVWVAAEAAPTLQAGPSLAGRVPAAATGFVEINEMGALPDRLKAAPWFQKLVHHPVFADRWGAHRGRLAEAAAQKLGVPAGPLVRGLFGRQVALVGRRPGVKADGLLVCRPVEGYSFAALVKAAGAEPVDSHLGVSILRAKAGYLLAQADGLVLLSKADLKDKSAAAWLKTAVACLAGKDQTTLAGKPAFKAQVGPLPRGAMATIYVEKPAEWHRAKMKDLEARAKTDRKVAARVHSRRARRRHRRMTAGPMGAARVLAMAVYTHSDRAVVEVRAAVDGTKLPAPMGEPGALDLVGRLPADTVFALGVRGDALGRYDAMTKAGGDRAARCHAILQGLTGVEDVRRDIAANIGAQKAVFMGRVPADQFAHKPGFDVPVLGAVLELTDAEPITQACTRLTQTVLAMTNLVGARKHVDGVIAQQQMVCGNTTIHYVSLRPVMTRVTRCPLFHELEWAWAVKDRHLVLATNAAYLKRVIEALDGRAPQLKTTTAYRAVVPSAQGHHLAVAQAQVASTMMKTWLDVVAAKSPQWLDPATWQKRWPRFRAGMPNPVQHTQRAQAVMSVLDAVGYRMQVQGDQLSATVQIVPAQGK